MANPPTRYELDFYTNTDLTSANWSKNFLKIIDWLTDGTYDLTVKSITLGSANMSITGNITASGSITAGTYYYGNGSNLTGIGINNKNWLINGDCQVDENGSDYTLVKDAWGTRANNWYGMATGTLVSAGTLTTSLAGIGTTGYEIKFATVTLTGSGVLYLRQQMPSTDAKKLIGQTVSIQARVKHDVGSSVNYTIYVGKASALDDFTTVTPISNSGNLVVTTGSAQVIKYEGVALGACGNGLEVKIGINCGAITAKNFEFTEIQLEISATITDFEFRPYGTDWMLSNPTLTEYLSLPPMGFSPFTETTEYVISESTSSLGASTLDSTTLGCMVNLPHGAIVTSFKVYWNRIHASATGSAYLMRAPNDGTASSIMAQASSDSSSGNHSVEDTSISNATIDNSQYSYFVDVTLNCSATIGDVYFHLAVIKYTVLSPIPG